MGTGVPPGVVGRIRKEYQQEIADLEEAIRENHKLLVDRTIERNRFADALWMLDQAVEVVLLTAGDLGLHALDEVRGRIWSTHNEVSNDLRERGQKRKTMNRLRFDYTNWRGEDHTYVVVPEKIEWAPHGAFDEDVVKMFWIMHARVDRRDDTLQGGKRRSFILTQIRNLEEVS